jgi:tetratricopeptide (TPR) repeat protein
VSAETNWNVGYVFALARHYDQAIDQQRKALELDPNFLPAHNQLGNAYIFNSMYKEGIAEFEKILAISPGNNVALSGLGYAYAVAGRKAEAQQVLHQMNELTKQKYVPAAYQARIYMEHSNRWRRATRSTL